MEFDFDQVIDRRGNNASTQDGFRAYMFGDEADDIVLPCADDEALSMWVADMAFAVPPAATDAMIERIAHPVFGYTGVFDQSLVASLRDWCQTRFGWAPESDHVVTARGVVPALKDLIDQIVLPGEKVLTLTPAYGQFNNACKRHGRELVVGSLVRIDSADGAFGYEIDFDDFATKVADPALKLFFLCHPHNPTGRVWTDEELVRMAELCFANDVVVVSDEIHCDLLRVGISHTPLAKLFPDNDQIITCMSASKTFNLAGLGLAFVIIPNDERRELWDDRVSSLVNPVSQAATTAVLREGGAWLAELCRYLDDNFALLDRRLRAELPKASFTIPEATYLAWVDVGPYFADPSINISRYVAESTGLLVEGADLFVSDAEGFLRLNLACPRSVLDDAISRLVSAMLAAETP